MVTSLGEWKLWIKTNCTPIKNLTLCQILFDLVLWHINHCKLFNAKSSLCIHIRYRWFVINNSIKQSFVYTQLNDQTVLFKQFNFAEVIYLHSVWMSNSSIWLIVRTLSGITTPGRVDLGAIAMKRYSAFPKAPALLESHHQIV